MAEIKIDNQEVIENLNKFTKQGLPDALFQALQKACLLIEATAKINCPVDDGQLRQSITTEVDKEKMRGEIGSIVEYAPYVEVGTGIYAKNGDGRKTPWIYTDAEGNTWFTRGQRPQPFLEPAADTNKDAIEEMFKGLI